MFSLSVLLIRFRCKNFQADKVTKDGPEIKVLGCAVRILLLSFYTLEAQSFERIQIEMPTLILQSVERPISDAAILLWA